MANIKYFIKSKGEKCTIHLRFTNGRKYDFKKSTPYKVNSDHWNPTKEQLRNLSVIQERDEINSNLGELKTEIIKQFNSDYKKGVNISSQWLEYAIDKFFNQERESNFDEFVTFGNYYIKMLPFKKNKSKKGEIGVSKRTIEKYQNILNKIIGFQKYKKKTVLFSEMDTRFELELIKYLKEHENLSSNTIGRTLTFVKTFIRESRSHGVKPHPEWEQISGFKEKIEFVYLNEIELKKIFEHDFRNSPYLDNARDWLIIGAYTGQRVSDFMSFTKDTIKDGFLEFEQKKTSSKTLVPIHDLVRAILNKYNGEFPRKISEQKFNEYIKEVCKQVGIIEIVEGRKINPETKRKEKGNYPKYELVSSHICRRSFATNHYGKLPTPVIMSITNHSTERMFLNYIGKTSKDHAKILQEYWDSIKGNKNENSHLRLSKSSA
ncbi:MAG: phage integrase SAM-like domain-containing protein [Cytophagales bacterium]